MSDPAEIAPEIEFAGLEPERPDGPPIEARRKLDRPVIDLRESFRALLPPVGTPAEGGELAGLARDYLVKGDEILRQAAERGASGAEVVHNRAWLMDYLIARLYSIADRRASRRFSSIRQESAIAGLGGYGRGELSFGSDVDLMLLYAWKVTPRIEYLWELLFLTLNDARIKVGFSTRTVEECVRIALDDRTARTALIDHRYVAGSRKLYDELEATMRARVSSKGTAPFIRETLAWAEERRAKHGDSIYLLEPNVKEGQGGLRDLHTALWVAKVWFKVRSVGELVIKGVLTPEEAERYASLEEFLWRIRNALHLIADKPTDRLTFDVQEKTARRLGYEDDAERRAVERFMQDYYRTASESLGFSKMLIARCQGPDNASTRILGYFTRRDVGDGFRIYRGELALTDLGSLKEHPERLVLAFDLAQKHGVPLAPATAERIAAEVDLLDEAAVRSPAVVKAFERIVAWKHDARPTLLEMHRAGVLERILPELRHLHYLVQHDLYHVYTVDVHSIHCLGEMQALLQGARAEELPLLSRVAAGVDDPFVALLGAFFHDIGKGLGGNHSEKGAAMVAEIGDRLGFPPERKDLLAFLVREHLAMPALAFRRDMNDPYVIHTLAKKVRDKRRLDYLYLVTAADIRAVGPTSWNAWRAGLLDELYQRTAETLESGASGSALMRARLEEAQRRVAEALAGAAPPETLAAYIAGLPEMYLLWAKPDAARAHFDLIERVRAGAPAALSVEHDFDMACSTVTVAAKDAPGLFSQFAGVLAANNLNILTAQAHTLDSGEALDAFEVSHHLPKDAFIRDERWRRLEADLAKVLSGETSVGALIAARRTTLAPAKRRADARTPTFVEFDNAASLRFTIVEVFTEDRLGLLYLITKTLFEQGLDIHLAKIVTQGNRVGDAFYVRDGRGAGGKIAAPERLAAIEAAVLEALGAAADAAPGPLSLTSAEMLD